MRTESIYCPLIIPKLLFPKAADTESGRSSGLFHLQRLPDKTYQ